jgi:four helix bundle protein
MKDFKKLNVWVRGLDIAVRVYKVCQCMSSGNQYSLGAQIKKSAVSIPSNLAEGSSRRTDRDKYRFAEIALGSAFELETQLLVGVKAGVIDDEDALKVMDELKELQASIYKYMNALKMTFDFSLKVTIGIILGASIMFAFVKLNLC